MGSKISLRRVARRSTGLLFAIILVTAPAVVLAGHGFNDVPDDHPFHDDISAIAEAGIAGGFGDGTYRPSDPVTRQSMAAFMHRGLGRVRLAACCDPMTYNVYVAAGKSYSLSQPVRELKITVPGQSNASSPKQLVYLQGRVQFETSMSSLKGCPCEFTAYIENLSRDDDPFGGVRWGPWHAQTFETHDPEGSRTRYFEYNVDVEALFAASPGPRTYRLMVSLSQRLTTINAANFALRGNSSLSAMTFPFGDTSPF